MYSAAQPRTAIILTGLPLDTGRCWVVRREGGAALVVGTGRGTECHPAGGDCAILNFREVDDTQRLRRITFQWGIEVIGLNDQTSRPI